MRGWAGGWGDLDPLGEALGHPGQPRGVGGRGRQALSSVTFFDCRRYVRNLSKILRRMNISELVVWSPKSKGHDLK